MSPETSWGTFTWSPGIALPDGALLPQDWAKRPEPARVYDYLLDGRDNYPADRGAAERLCEQVRWLPKSARVNRRYAALTAALLVRRGISQILDLGCGYPSPPGSGSRYIPNVYEAVARVRPGCVVVHAERHPIVASYVRALMGGPLGQHRCVLADIADIDRVLEAPEIQGLDRARPVAVLLHDVLPWIADDIAVHKIMAVLRAWLPPGSAISITHATPDLAPRAMSAVVGEWEQAGVAFRPRTKGQVRALFGEWPLLDPGLVPTGLWHADHPHASLPPHISAAYAGIATSPVNADSKDRS